jgi:hypothetical protein
MKTFRPLATLLCVALVCCRATAGTWTETFSTNPAANGWQVFGDTNLFRWDSTNQNLAVTWDSSRSNSFFARPFDTILAKQDDFTFAFDLRLTDLAVGVATNKPNAMPVSVGLVNLVNATNSAVWRGTGVNATHGARNVCEFTYFAAAGTIVDSFSPVLIATNNSYFYFADGLNQLLDPGAQFRVTMNYTAATRTLTTSVTRNGAAYGGVPDIIIPSTATRDFRLDRFAINNWTDTGTSDSLLAHGVVDNITVTVPPPAVQNFSGARSNNNWIAQFTARTNFSYTLERSADLQSWTNASPTANGANGAQLLSDTNTPAAKCFYRVRAERP